MARILVDPMRRAILDLLRATPMTQAQLAKELGLAPASLNYHIRILRSKKLVSVEKKEREKHKIMQIFFSPAAYLFVYDLDSLPKSIARYFYPLSLERTRGMIACLRLKGQFYDFSESPEDVDKLVEVLARSLVEVARNNKFGEVGYGSEKIVYEIYVKAMSKAIKT